jgi:O-antigen/teichoic acid export membrane protein
MRAAGVGARFLTLGLGETVARLCAFGATVYLARTLGPASYGVVSVVAGIMLYLTQIADGGIELAGIPLVARARDDVATVASPILSARLVLAAAVVGLTMVAAPVILPPLDASLLTVASLALLATGLSTRWVHLGLERPGSVAVARLAGELSTLGLVLALVSGIDDVRSVPVAQVAGAALTTVVLGADLWRRGTAPRWIWQPARAIEVFRRSKHLIVFTLLGLLLFNFDLIYLRYRTGDSAAGLYASAYTLIAFAANIIVAFAHTVLPNLARSDDDRDQRVRLFHTASVQALTIALPVGVGASFVASDVMTLVFSSDYAEGAVALAILALSIPIAALRELPVIGLLAAQRETRLLIVNALTVVTNVTLVVLTVPRFGIVGAAACTLLTEILRWILAARFAAECGFPPPRWHRLAKGVGATAAMAGALLAFGTPGLFVTISLGGAVFVVTLALLRGVRLQDGVPVLSV